MLGCLPLIVLSLIDPTLALDTNCALPPHLPYPPHLHKVSIEGSED